MTISFQQVTERDSYLQKKSLEWTLFKKQSQYTQMQLNALTPFQLLLLKLLIRNLLIDTQSSGSICARGSGNTIVRRILLYRTEFL